MPKSTQVLILLDRSGSMKTIWDEALSSINAYVDQLDPKTKINFAVFDSNSYDVIRNCLVKDWTALSPKAVEPRGMTPLYDSIVRSINTAESINAPKTVLVVMTDGFENASKTTNLWTVKEKLRAFEDRGWQVVMLGANFDSITDVSNQLGIKKSKSADFRQDTMVMNMSDLGVRTMAYAATGASIEYSDADKTRLGL